MSLARALLHLLVSRTRRVFNREGCSTPLQFAAPFDPPLLEPVSLQFNSIFIAAASENKRNMKNSNIYQNTIQRNSEMHALYSQSIQYNTDNDNKNIQNLSRLQSKSLLIYCAFLLIDNTCFADILINKVWRRFKSPLLISGRISRQ